MAITAEEQTNIIQLVVGMVGAAPGADILADLVAAADAGQTLEELAISIANHPAYAGDTGLFPDYLPNAIFASQILTALIGDEVTAEILTAAIEEMTAELNAAAGDTFAERAEARGIAVNTAITSLAASTDPDFADAAAALANQTAAAEYYSVTVAQGGPDATLADLQAPLAGVDSTDASLTTATAAIDAAVPVVPFDLSTGLAALTAAQAATAAYLTAEATTAGVIAAAPATAAGVYNGLVGGSTLGTDSAELQAALLSDQIAANAAALIGTQGALAAQNVLVDAVAGLTSAVATAVAAQTADTAAIAAAAVTQIAEDTEIAAWGVNVAATTDVDTPVHTDGVITVLYDNAAGIFADNTMLTLTAVTNGVAGLAVVNVAWTDAQKTFFALQQATTGLAELIVASNADAAAKGAAVGTGTALTTANDTVNFLDIGAAATELANIGAGFTITTNPGADATQAEIAAEEAALVADEAVKAILAAATQIATDAADAAQVVARDAADDGGDIETDGATSATIAADTIVIAADGSATATLEAAANSDLLDSDGTTVTLSAGIVLDGGGVIAALLAASQTALDARLADVAADSAESAAETAISDFDGLITLFDTANSTTPLTAPLAAMLTAVSDDEDDIEALADAVVDVTDAATAVAALAVFTAAEAAALTALDDEGYAVPNAVDAPAEFGTIDDDIFVAGTVDSSIYSINVQGEDTLYIGTAHTVNTTDIGAGTDQTLLTAAGDVLAMEVFLVDTGADVEVIIETENYGSETGDYTTITLIGVGSVDDVTIVDGFVTVA